MVKTITLKNQVVAPKKGHNIPTKSENTKKNRFIEITFYRDKIKYHLKYIKQ